MLQGLDVPWGEGASHQMPHGLDTDKQSCSDFGGFWPSAAASRDGPLGHVRVVMENPHLTSP